MAKELGIIDILAPFGFDSRLATKLVRHQDARYDVPSLIRDGWFDLYQRLQARPVFKGCEQIISFVGDGSTRARFLGVYRVLEQKSASKTLLPKDCPFPQWGTTSKYYYELKRQTEYADLEERVVIDWGSGALAWHQHLKNKRVVEILPKGRALEPFTDYLDFTLTHSKLKELISHASAHRDWQASLSAVAGVYLILAQSAGHQYVGSAYGLDGFWGRWTQYAANGHGGNGQLRELIDSDGRYPEGFRYSIVLSVGCGFILPEFREAACLRSWLRA